MIPQIVDAEHLPRVNAQTQSISGIATIIGPTLGGLMVAWVGYLPVFFINACSYLISAGCESFMHLPQLEKNVAGPTKITEDIMAGCRYVGQRKNMIVILGMVGLIHFFVGGIEAVIPVLAAGFEGRGAANIGYIQSCLGLGTVLAAIFISLRNRVVDEALFLFGSVFMIGMLLLTMGAGHMAGIRFLPSYLVLFLLIGGAVLWAGTSFRSILQKEVDDTMMGRVFGLVSSVGNLSIPLAVLIFGVSMEVVPPGAMLAASGFVLLPVSIIAYHRYIASVSWSQRKKPTRDHQVMHHHS